MNFTIKLQGNLIDIIDLGKQNKKKDWIVLTPDIDWKEKISALAKEGSEI